MAYKTRPTPLKDPQITGQACQSRRYLILDAHSSLPSPAYPFDCPLQPGGSPTWRVKASDHHRNDSLDSYDGNLVRSFTLPISPPALSSGQDTEYSSKRSGRTFAFVPAQVDGKRVLTHVFVNPQGNDCRQNSHSLPISPQEDGLPEDMQDILRQLDDLAGWVKAASSSRDYNLTSIMHATCLPGPPGIDDGRHIADNLGDGVFRDKGKDRLLSTISPSECDIRQDLSDSSRGSAPGNPTKIFPPTNCQLEGFIYVPNCNTPEFLVGSSSSPIAYPVCGYSSHPSRYSPLSPDATHGNSYHRRFLERRSATCSTPPSPLISPPSGKTSFKMLFQRSRCNTTAVARPSISSGHVPVENALRQRKRMRLPWLRI